MSQVVTAKWLICRICLKGENKILYNIFEPIADEEIKDLGTSLHDKIELCGAIKLCQQHNLPNKICNRCVLLLRAAYKFRDLCQQSQNQLKQFITTHPQKDDESEEALEIHFDSEPEEQRNEAQEEVDNSLIRNTAYVEEDNVEYDVASYEPEQSLISKNYDYIATFQEEDVEVQHLGDDESSQYVLQEVDDKQIILEENEDEITNFNYDEDNNSNDIVIEERIKKTGRQFFVKHINQKKAAVKRKRKSSKSECFNGIYSCTFCDNTYTDKTKYTNHIKIHVRDKPHECEICKKCFSTTPQLSRHMNSHTGNRPYKCQYCEASFGDPSTKIKHERIHTNERPYKCCLCDKAFAYSNVLKVHMMTHTGEKPYSCEYCGRSFSQVHHKNAHEKRHANVNMVILQNSPEIEYMEEDDLKEYKLEETG